MIMMLMNGFYGFYDDYVTFIKRARTCENIF